MHVPAPGYPLFEQLAALEGVASAPCPLVRRGARWRIDLDAFAAALTPRSRAVVAIDPHNPTGCFVDPDDWGSLRSIARERGLALISDEVFADYGYEGARPTGALASADAGPLHFVLSGASKVLALPQLKIAWIVVAGPATARDEALARLEFIADAYLSVPPLLAGALPELLEQREAIQHPIRARVARNRAAITASGLEVLPAEAGWQAIVRVAGHDEDALAAALLDAGVLAQPGALFDLEEHGRRTSRRQPAARACTLRRGSRGDRPQRRRMSDGGLRARHGGRGRRRAGRVPRVALARVGRVGAERRLCRGDRAARRWRRAGSRDPRASTATSSRSASSRR